MDAREILVLPMQPNDADAKTIGEYLSKLLLNLWEEQESFSGKRPFGNSDWDSELHTALAINGVLPAEKVEEDPDYWELADYGEADRIIKEAIESLFLP
jgi:hypothetical protein